MKELLQLHVIWHPASRDGEAYGERLFRFFQHDPDAPILRGLGIPVRWWREPDRILGVPVVPPLGEASHNAIVVVWDEAMSSDPRWSAYIEAIGSAMKARGTADRMFHLRCCEHGPELPASLGPLHGIRVYEHATAEERIRAVLVHLTIGMGRALAAAGGEEKPPSRLFLSHTKMDEHALRLALDFKAYVGGASPYDTFFDGTSPIGGEDWQEQLKDSVRESALVIFQSDAYSSRRFCQRELLLAKEHDRPIIVVHCVRNGEVRVFPYLGNVPALRFEGNDYGPILELATFEVFRAIYQRRLLTAVRAGNSALSGYRVLFRPPELLTCAYYKETGFLYPDPPLAGDELRVLEVHAGRAAVTPSTAHLVS